MNREANVRRFERLLMASGRSGAGRMISFLRATDFYQAPASTRYHLSVPGGLLQHSLNVYDALKWILRFRVEDSAWHYWLDGADATGPFTKGNLIITGLLHDVCKVGFYQAGIRNVKNEATGVWEKKACYTVNDQMPLGHGPKSVLLIQRCLRLETEELYAIWHHMGPAGESGERGWYEAVAKHPLVLALYAADVTAARIMEDVEDNRPAFQGTAVQAGEAAGGPAADPVLPDQPRMVTQVGAEGREV